jgi:hypothetical protein
MFKIGIAAAVVLLFVPLSAYGEMSSGNYNIYADSIGFNGGNYSTSTNYALSDTIGESGAASVSSTTYTLNGGYQAMIQDDVLAFTIATTSVALGTLSKTAVNAADTAFYVSCNAVSGYSVSIGAVTGSMPAAVSDGAVTIGSDEYGLSTSGDAAATRGDVAVTNGLVLASASGAVHNATTTVTFKASYSTTQAGSYSQTITLTASANF